MKYVLEDLAGDVYIVVGKGTFEQAKTDARSKGARGHLVLTSIEASDVEKAISQDKSLAELWKRAKRRGE